MLKNLLLFTVSCASLFVGGSIYLAWRPESLLMFQWADAVGLIDPLSSLRAYAAPYRVSLPAWVLYSFPEALWVYSGTCFMASLWSQLHCIPAFLWVSSIPTLAVLSEVAQWFHLIPGTYSFTDLALSILVVPVALLTVRLIKGGLHVESPQAHLIRELSHSI